MATGAILAQFDASAWAGLTLYTRDGTDIDAPALATMHDLGIYPDPVAFLNGWASYRNLTSTLQAQWSGTGTPDVGIDADGFFYVRRVGGAGSFTVTPGTDDPWGWGGVVTSTSVGGSHRATATRPWTRGQFVADTDAQFTIVESATEVVPAIGTVAHSLPTLVCGQTTADADEVVETLEKWDNAAKDAGSKRIKWGIDNEGRVFTSWPSGASWDIVWVETSFRDALGFDGTETAVLANGVYLLTATHAPRGVLLCRAGLQTMDPRRSHTGTAHDLVSGVVAGRSVSTWRELEVAARLQTTMGLADTSAGYADEAEVWLHRVSPYLFPGARCTVLPRWGDPRLGRSLPEQKQAGLTPVLNSAAIVGAAAGVTGRRRGYVSTASARDVALTFDGSGPRTQTVVSLTVRCLDG